MLEKYKSSHQLLREFGMKHKESLTHIRTSKQLKENFFYDQDRLITIAKHCCEHIGYNTSYNNLYSLTEAYHPRLIVNLDELQINKDKFRLRNANFFIQRDIPCECNNNSSVDIQSLVTNEISKLTSTIFVAQPVNNDKICLIKYYNEEILVLN
jgi:hypothetical protein